MISRSDIPLMCAGSQESGFIAYGMVDPRARVGSSLSRRGGESVEPDIAVRLRPQPDLAGDGLRQRVLQVGLAVEEAFDLGAADADLQVMPLAGRRRRVADPFHRRALALLELPQHQVVFQAVGADGQVVAVRPETEQDARPLVDAAGN